jgi:hypothetical protein
VPFSSLRISCSFGPVARFLPSLSAVQQPSSHDKRFTPALAEKGKDRQVKPIGLGFSQLADIHI